MDNRCEGCHHRPRNVEPGQAHRHRDALHPLLESGCSERDVLVSLGPQGGERCQLPINVFLGTIPPLGEEREAVTSRVQSAPSFAAIFEPPSIAVRAVLIVLLHGSTSGLRQHPG